MIRTFISFIIIILLFSCTLDYSDSDLTDELSAEIPDMEIFDYESVEIRDGEPALKITAGEAQFYNSKEETYLKDVQFFNYEDSEISSQGKTDSAILKMKSGDASLSGNIIIESEEDDSFLTAETLNWTDEEKRLTSEPDDQVTVKDKEGSEMKGIGFSADLKRNTIEFNGKIEGEYVSE